MSWIRNQLKKDEGFTLIELMVVVLIIAILIAIAIPTFLGARERAQDRAAQSDLRNALTAAKVHYTDTEDFSDGAGADVTVAQLEAIEPSLQFVAIAASDADNVGYAVDSVAGTDRQQITFAKQSASGTWFCINETATGAGSGTFFASSETALVDVDTAGECNGASW